MALKKTIKKKNGLTFDYHRISTLTVEVNQRTTILLYSYLDEAGRNYEKDYESGKITGKPEFPYKEYQYLSFPYDEKMNLNNAYSWLKKQPEFLDAIDV